MKLAVVVPFYELKLPFWMSLYSAEQHITEWVTNTNRAGENLELIEFLHWGILAPKLHEKNNWNNQMFEYLSAIRNELIKFIIQESKEINKTPDWWMVADDDVILNPEIFFSLYTIPKDCKAFSAHHYSFKFKRELITKQTPEDKGFFARIGKIITYKSHDVWEKLPPDIYPD